MKYRLELEKEFFSDKKKTVLTVRAQSLCKTMPRYLLGDL